MISSLRFRLWLTYVLVVGVVITIAGLTVAVYLLRNPALDRREIQRLRLLSNLVLQRYRIFNLPEGGIAAGRLDDTVERVDNATGVRVLLFNSSGELLADSRSDRAAPLLDWSTLARRTPGQAAIFRDETGRQWLYTITPLENGSFLMLSVPRIRAPVLNVLRDEFLSPFFRGAVLSAILSLLLAFWITRWITAPLQRMADAAHAVSAGEFRKIPRGGPREVQSVVNAFNEMGERVQASQRSQRDFIANVSHDLKTPLTSIQGFAQAILDGTAQDPQASKQAAEVIYKEAGTMHRMVLDLLELARLDSGVMSFERSQLEMGDILRGVVEKFTPQARDAGVQLIFHPDRSQSGTLPKIIGDADRLSQAFSNLVDNAIKHTSTGGKVTLIARSNMGWLDVLVSDEGPGIPEEELSRIFERFYQTDKSRTGGERRGVGLGLAITREIVEAHGGKIEVYNRSGGAPGRESISHNKNVQRGCVFAVKLPIARSQEGTVARFNNPDQPS